MNYQRQRINYYKEYESLNYIYIQIGLLYSYQKTQKNFCGILFSYLLIKIVIGNFINIQKEKKKPFLGSKLVDQQNIYKAINYYAYCIQRLFKFYKRAKVLQQLDFFILIKMITNILITLLSTATVSYACINSSTPAGCTALEVNNNPSYYCRCLTCGTGLKLSYDKMSCCYLNVTNYCLRCSSSLTCTQCVGQYGFNGSKCVRCDSTFPNCTACYSINAVCTACDSYYALNSSICVRCYEFMPYCGQCSSSRTNCYNCNISIYAVNPSVTPNRCDYCNRTLPYCSLCQNERYCYSCYNSSYVLQSNYGSYRFCIPCISFMSGCYTCGNPYYCYSCINNSYVLNKVTYRCDPCNSSIPNCLICKSSIFCLQCGGPKYALVHLLNISVVYVCQECGLVMMDCLYCESSTSCTTCSKGRKVNFGCTTITGCITVDSNVSTDANCLICDPLSFFMQPVDRSKCICYQGWLVGQHCTNILGCTGLIVENYVKKCKNCNYSAHFIIQNGRCVCQQYYYFSYSSQTCNQTCGDGRLIQLPCDDGNLINGDGCSSQCKVQSQYTCINNKDKNPASFCKYKGRVQLTLNGIFKVSNQNQLEIIFDISPYNDALLKMNLTKSINFDSNGSNLTSSSILSQQIILKLKFYQNIEGSSAKILIKFDSDYVIIPDFKLKFSMVESTGLSLSYVDQNNLISANNSLNKIMTILGIVCLVIFILGSISYKMIGVQTVQTLQIILMLQAQTKYFQSFFKCFQNLQVVLGQFSRIIRQREPTKENYYLNLGYQTDIGQNYITFIILNGMVILVYTILKLIQYNLSCRHTFLLETIDKNNIAQMESLRKIQIFYKKCCSWVNILYNFCVFPTFIGFYYHFLNTNLTHIYSNRSDQPRYELLSIVLIFIPISIIYFSQIKIFLTLQKSQPRQQIIKAEKAKYVAYYLIYSIIIYILIQVSQFKIINYDQLMNLGAVTSYLLFIIIYVPYQHFIHNFSLIINQLSILFTAVWIVLKECSFYNNQIQSKLLYVFIADVALIQIFAVLRILLQLRKFYQSYKMPTKTKGQNMKKKKYVNSIKAIIKEDLRHMTRNNVQFSGKIMNVDAAIMTFQSQIGQKKKIRQEYKKMLLKKYQNGI